MTNKKQKMIDEVLEGVPVTAFDIIDAHCHLGCYHNFYIPECTAAQMVHAMDRVGIKCCVVASHAGITTDYIQGNTQTLQAMRDFPGRILGYCSINPNYPAEEITDELKRCFEAGMIAIKFHPGLHNYPIDGDRYAPAWEFANEHNLCVLTHTDMSANSSVIKTGDCAGRYPNAKVLFGHSGFGYAGAHACIEVAKKTTNTWFDITSSTPDLGLVEFLVDGIGVDRVLFATDLPFIDCRMQIGRMAFSALDDDQLRLVLAGNARKLFGL